MKYSLLLFVPLILSSCSFWNSTPDISTPVNPYPTIQSGSSLPPATGGSYEAQGDTWTGSITASGVSITASGVSTQYATRQSQDRDMTRVSDMKGEFFLTIEKQDCTLGIEKYDYKATVMRWAETLTGCALEK